MQSPSFSPLYQQIKSLISQRIQAGEWQAGEVIPSELELAARFKVSQGTVRKAVDELAAEHLVVRRQGRGTFVATHSEQRVQFRFLRLSADDGSQHPMQRHVIDCKRLKAPADVARALGLQSAAPVLRVRRTLSVAQQPVVLDDIWLPAELFKGLTAERLSQYKGAMYAFFEAEFGVRMLKAQEKIRAVAASGSAAALLRVPEGHPLLSVERLSLSWENQPVELRRGLYRTEEFHYRNELA